MNEHLHPDLLDDELGPLIEASEECQRSGPSERCPSCLSTQVRSFASGFFTRGCAFCGSCW